MCARLTVLWLCLLVCTATLTSASDDFEVKGRVVDQQGRPVANAEVGRFWSAHGEVFKADGTPIFDNLADPDQRRAYEQQVGKLVSLSHGDKITSQDGTFRIEIGGRPTFVLAMNAERTQGGVAIIPEPYRGELLEIRLESLIRVRGNMVSQVPGKSAGWTMVIVEAPEIPSRPLAGLRLLMCGSYEGRFDFKLPPGDYVLDAYGISGPFGDEDIDLRVRPHPKLTLSADKRDVDLGALQLTAAVSMQQLLRESKERGDWRDYTEHYGETPPEWHVTDARGVPKEVRIADFRGKWLLIDFWGLGCAPCLSRGIPKLVDLYEKHAGMRDQFAVVGVFIDY